MGSFPLETGPEDTLHDAAEVGVPTHTDQPRRRLGLPPAIVARFVAEYLRDIRATEQDETSAIVVEPAVLPSPVLHLDGLGSDRAQALQVLEHELAQDPNDPWIVVRFDAYGNQRLGNALAHLAAVVVRAAYREASTPTRRRRAAAALGAADALARPSIRYAIAAAAAAIVVAVWALGLLPPLVAGLIALAAASSAVLTLSRMSRGVGAWLSKGFRRPQDLFETDNEGKVGEHFRAALSPLKQPVAVLVDRLDDCKPGYVVEVLEIIKTQLVAGAALAYVVAADRQWIARSYLEDYPVAHRSADAFVGDMFQVSVRVPRVSAKTQRRYWEELISEPKPVVRELSVDEVAILIRSAPGMSSLEVPPTDALARAAAAEFRTDTEADDARAFLRAAVQLLGPPNPRLLKRFIAAYRLQLQLDLATGQLEPRSYRQSALWMILNVRWPSLADYLAAEPDQVRNVGRRTPAKAPDPLKPLFHDPQVKRVIRGEGVGVALDPAAITARVEI